MAPEASLGNKIDHRIDIYSLGVTFYQLLSGQTLFDAPKASEVLKSHIRDTRKTSTRWFLIYILM